MIERRKSQEIKNLLLVLLLGVIAAVGFFFSMLYFYGSSGRYAIKQVAFQPETLDKPLVGEGNGKGKLGSYIFDAFEFIYWHEKSREWKTVPIDRLQYGDFYAIIADDLSVTPVTRDIESLFQRSDRLQMIVRSTSSAEAPVKSLQAIQFSSEGQYYRVELLTADAERWAYFHHAGILEKVMKLFVERSL